MDVGVQVCCVCRVYVQVCDLSSEVVGPISHDCSVVN